MINNKGIAIVTGASKGLGASFVDGIIKVHPQIDEIWIIARNKDALEKIKSKYTNKKIIVLPLDLSDINSYNLIDEKLKSENKTIQLMISNAALCINGDFNNVNLNDSLKMIDLNIKGTIAFTKVCLPYIESKGQIILVSSTSAFVPNPGLSVYSATKSFILDFGISLKEELKIKKINVCTVCPGFMLTDMTKNNMNKKKERLPKVDPKTHAIKALKASKRGKTIYTTGLFYKFYRLIAKIFSKSLIIKFARLE